MTPSTPRDLLRLTFAASWPVAVGYSIITLIGTASGVLLPAMLGRAVDTVLDPSHDVVPLALFLAVVLVLTCSEIGGELFEAKITTGSTARWRHSTVRHLLRLDLKAQRRMTPGDALHRLTMATAETSRLVPTAVGTVASAGTSAAGIVALFLIDYWLGLLFVVAAPILFLLVRGYFQQTARLVEGYQAAQSALLNRFLNAVEGVRTIRASGSVDREISRVLEPLPEIGTHGMAYWESQRRMSGQLLAIAPILQVGVLATAGLGILTDRITPGEWVAVSGYLTFAMGIFRQVGTVAQLGYVRGSATRLAEVFALPPTLRGTRRFPAGAGRVQLRQIRVAEGDSIVLDGIDVDIPGGWCVAVVGASGVGKSSLAAVISGLRQPDAGSVHIDGVPLAEADPGELRHVVACAFERPRLFGDRLSDALRHGAADVDSAAMDRALRAAAADTFVSRLPERLDTPLGRLRLSGGEWQRLGLARAFCRGARVLVLDDALSSLDGATELTITRAVATLPVTRVVVTHRRSTAARADAVIWISAGSVAGFGRHDDLMGRPDYRELFGASSADQKARVPR